MINLVIIMEDNISAAIPNDAIMFGDWSLNL